MKRKESDYKKTFEHMAEIYESTAKAAKESDNYSWYMYFQGKASGIRECMDMIDQTDMIIAENIQERLDKLEEE